MAANIPFNFRGVGSAAIRENLDQSGNESAFVRRLRHKNAKKSSNLWLQLYCTRRHRCALASHAYADIAYKYAAIEYNYLYKYTAGHFNLTEAAQSPTSMRTCMNCICCSLTFVFLADQERVPAGDSTQVLRQHIKLCPTAPGHCRRRDKAHLSVPLANLLERVSRLLADWS